MTGWIRVANAAWNIVIAWIIVTALTPFFEDQLHLRQAHALAVCAMIFAGFVGLGLGSGPLVQDHLARTGHDRLALVRRARR